MKHAVVHVPATGIIAAVFPEGDPRLEGTHGLLTVLLDLDDDKAAACRRGEWMVKNGKLARVKSDKDADKRPKHADEVE
jgi:hypothetical protein